MQLRYYQKDAIDACYSFLRSRQGEHPAIVIPTGGGKTPILATIASDVVNRWKGRCLIVTHSKELIQQSADKLKQVDSQLPVGIYSASLNKRDISHPVICAGIQSIYKKAGTLGRFDIILIDEAHLIPVDGEGMYRTFLQDTQIVNPNVRMIGLTATPYRLTDGLIYGDEMLFSDVCYEIGVMELIQDGFLCPLVSKRGHQDFTAEGIKKKGKEYDQEQVANVMMEAVTEAVDCLIERTQDRKSILIFASSIDHAFAVGNEIASRDVGRVEIVTGDNSVHERDVSIGGFKAGDIRFLLNVRVLTTGFDAPNVDCVAMMMSTMSPGLYYQIAGRGFRLHSGKQDCLVLDFGGNISRHGPVDMIQPPEKRNKKGAVGTAPTKTCPNCFEIITVSYATCPNCEYVFPVDKKVPHDSYAADDSPLSGEITEEEFEVMDVLYTVHKKKGSADDHPKTMRVDYVLGANAIQEYVCVEHQGFAREKAEAWWALRSSGPCPDSAEEAVSIANAGGIKLAERITVRRVSGNKFPEVVNPVLVDPTPALGWDEEPNDGNHELASAPAQRALDFWKMDTEDLPF